MPRKKFLQDLEQAKENPPAHVTDIERYEDDGVSLTYWYSRGGLKQEICLKLITTNVDDYPDGNQFMLFTDDIDVDPIITDTFVHIQAVIDGSSIPTALREISGGLHQAFTLGLAENPIVLDNSSQGPADSDMDDFDLGDQTNDDDDDASFGLDDLLSNRPTARSLEKVEDRVLNENMTAIKADLRAAKDAGFKVGVYGDLSKGGTTCISVRVTKLGISEEAMQAWGLLRNQYLVLLIRFQRGYRFLAQVIDEAALPGSVEMRIGLCNSYKPRFDEASAIFIHEDTKEDPGSSLRFHKREGTSTEAGLQPLFIGRPINDLLRSRFSKIVQFRQQFNLPWGGAERLFNDRQGALLSDLSKELTAYQEPEKPMSTRALPDIVMEDALSECGRLASLPLVAMQFVLRHLVRCTEFCLVCHCRVEDTFEALKPYVCSSPLCLYQFLALGFGPSAEWEIFSQPYVVDLLISLCYAQAQASRMREFPLGINLKIPMLPNYKTITNFSAPYYRHGNPAPTPSESLPESVKAFRAKYYSDKKLLAPIPDSWASGKQCVRKGDWIVLVTPKSGTYHCRICDEQGVNFVLGSVIHREINLTSTSTEKDVVKQITLDVDCYLYDANFDELPNQYRHYAITTLLDTLPSVSNMRTSLAKQQGGQRDANLKSLRDQCPQAALDLLRWIIASNRSCIMQVDQVAASTDGFASLTPSEDRVSGMDEWMQFRFAQGAPDKEQRFVDCVRKKSRSTQYPTLFAWHGSPIGNWHSIIRQGLNYDEILHGRASGNGVYMSPFLGTSMSYTGQSNYVVNGRGTGTSFGWPNSELKVSSVVSLQEVVNAPSSFVSQSPHFVVAEKDWIQTRYLFVKTNIRHSKGSAAKVVYQQDPSYTVKGMSQENIAIPITAISRSRRPSEGSSSNPKSKKRKIIRSLERGTNDFDDEMSVATDEEDRRLLDAGVDDPDWFDSDDIIMTDAEDVFEEVVNRPRVDTASSNNRKRSLESRESFILDRSRTDFVPGALDTTGIRFLNPPKYASITASKALSRAFRDAVKTQECTPLHELGFYLDPNRMENMYQWIVELHSFEKTLPLAQDMKSAGITSIVIEMQFTSEFPFSPPFVRVVKPRFLDPMMGGGGHVTNGGAICMELLTSNGWSAVNSIESVLLQVRMAMTERERPARLLSNQKGYQTAPYGVGEAISAYKRFCQKHGWQAPKGLDGLASL